MVVVVVAVAVAAAAADEGQEECDTTAHLAALIGKHEGGTERAIKE